MEPMIEQSPGKSTDRIHSGSARPKAQRAHFLRSAGTRNACAVTDFSVAPAPTPPGPVRPQLLNRLLGSNLPGGPAGLCSLQADQWLGDPAVALDAYVFLLRPLQCHQPVIDYSPMCR